MNSCIYTAKLWHAREKPARNSFKYSIYMLYFDLDEIDKLAKNIRIFSRNRWNVLSFYDSDHFKFTRQKGTADAIVRDKINYNPELYKGKNTKQRIRELVKELSLGFEPVKVYCLTSVRNLGYIFNPVSFYFCYDMDKKLRAIFSEVNNTFHDQKMFYMKTNPGDKLHKDKQQKNYYISPFIDHDTDLTWEFMEPGKELHLKINSVKGETVLRTSLDGKRKEITNSSMIFTFLRYPMMTFMTIFLIHYQALKLYFKKVPFRAKKATDKKIVKSL